MILNAKNAISRDIDLLANLERLAEGVSELALVHTFGLLTLFLQDYGEGESFKDALLTKLKDINNDIVKVIDDHSNGDEELFLRSLNFVAKTVLEVKYPTLAAMASKKVVEMMLQNSSSRNALSRPIRVDIPVRVETEEEVPAKVVPVSTARWTHVPKLGADFKKTLEIDKKRQETDNYERPSDVAQE